MEDQWSNSSPNFPVFSGGGGKVKGKGKKGRLISPSPSPILNLPSAKP